MWTKQKSNELNFHFYPNEILDTISSEAMSLMGPTWSEQSSNGRWVTRGPGVMPGSSSVPDTSYTPRSSSHDHPRERGPHIKVLKAEQPAGALPAYEFPDSRINMLKRKERDVTSLMEMREIVTNGKLVATSSACVQCDRMKGFRSIEFDDKQICLRCASGYDDE